ncbi:MAG: FAD-binding protein [Bacteroidales bacterium]|nr:FAD-binding protein [Bacteroidales bacterium]
MRYDAVVIGGGRSGCAEALRRASDGQKVCLVAAGLTLHSLEPELRDKPYSMLHALTKAGVAVLRGDIACEAVWDTSAGGKLSAVKTANGVTLEAGEFVLATGRFFSKGLIADMDGIREPLFGADVDYPEDRSKWFDPDFFAPQPFESFGVKTDRKGRILKDGKAVENVYAAGKILGGKHNAGK